jgi:Uma2 family endonuclease
LIDHVPRQDCAVFSGDTSIEIPHTLRLDGLPMPDAFVVRGTLNQYSRRLPNHRDVALVVEVSDSSLGDDRGKKLRQYALGEIPEYWIVNLVDRRVEAYTRPTGPDHPPAYRHREDYGPGRSVPLVMGGVEIAAIAVDDLLPPPEPGGGVAPRDAVG